MNESPVFSFQKQPSVKIPPNNVFQSTKSSETKENPKSSNPFLQSMNKPASNSNFFESKRGRQIEEDQMGKSQKQKENMEEEKKEQNNKKEDVKEEIKRDEARNQ